LFISLGPVTVRLQVPCQLVTVLQHGPQFVLDCAKACSTKAALRIATSRRERKIHLWAWNLMVGNVTPKITKIERANLFVFVFIQALEFREPTAQADCRAVGMKPFIESKEPPDPTVPIHSQAAGMAGETG
jgi:hypothetical protein